MERSFGSTKCKVWPTSLRSDRAFAWLCSCALRSMYYTQPSGQETPRLSCKCDVRESLVSVERWKTILVDLRLSFHQLDGYQEGRRQRPSVSDVTFECRLDFWAGARHWSIFLDDGPIRPYQSFEPSALRNIVETKMDLLWLSDLYAQLGLLSSLSVVILILHHHIPLV